MGQFSNFVEVSQIHPDVVNWVYRVQTAGAQPSQKTVNVLNNFYETLISNNLSSSMKAVNCFVPDSLIAAKTPLIANYGSSSWNDISGTFVSGDLTISGLKGNGSNKALDTGIDCTKAFSVDTSVGITIYNTTNPGAVNESDFGYFNWNTNGDLMFYIEWSDTTTIFDSWYFSGGGQIASEHAGWTGYSSGNRISSVNTAIYYANSTTAHATLITAATGAGTRQSRTCWCFGSNNDSGGTRPYSSKTYSFLALHDGLTVGQSSTFFNLIQTMRKQLGGGYT